MQEDRQGDRTGRRRPATQQRTDVGHKTPPPVKFHLPFSPCPIPNLSLYRLLAPIYDPFARAVSRTARRDAVQQVVLDRSDHVLVAGCGTGLSLPLLSRRLPDGWIEAVDRSPAMLYRARRTVRRHALSNTGVRLGDLRRLPYPPATFDAVLCAYVLDVLSPPDRRTAVHEIRRVVRPGGRAVVVTPALPQRPLDRLWQGIAHHAPILLGRGEPTDIRPLLLSAGFTVTAHRYTRSNTFLSAQTTAKR